MTSRRCQPYLAPLLAGIIGTGAVVAQADAPPAAGAAVRQALEAVRANDAAAFLAVVADDFDYNGLKKKDLDPFGRFQLLYDRLLYRILQVAPAGPGVATAVVEADFTARWNLGPAPSQQPSVVGHSRTWLELRQQSDGQWRISASRFIQLHFASAGWQPPSPLQHNSMTVNSQPSVDAAPGASLLIRGQSSYGTPDNSYQFDQVVAIGASSREHAFQHQISKNEFARRVDETWATDLVAPKTAGRYVVDSGLFLVTTSSSGARLLAWDEVTVPVVVK